MKILKKVNFNHSFTIENITIPHKLTYLMIPRIDCNKFLYDKAD